MPLRFAVLATLMLAAATPAPARSTAAQDSTLDNLSHAPGYRTVPPGSLGAVIERGTGPVDMVLVSGFGVGASAFEGFTARNAARYHMLAITLPGFEGTQAPPMPPAGTSYGDNSWTRAATDAVVKLIRARGLDRPVLVGHFINGTQVAVRIALEHPDLVRAVVLLAGTPRFEPVRDTPGWPRNLTLEKKILAVDRFSAPRWFKTVTRDTWVRGNFVASDYSTDSARGQRFADLANRPPLPVLVRWLCEFHASDLRGDLEGLRTPLLLLQPAFTDAVRADSTRQYLQGYFEEPWKGRLDGRTATEVAFLDRAGILVMDDQPAAVDRRIAEFLGRHGR